MVGYFIHIFKTLGKFVKILFYVSEMRFLLKGLETTVLFIRHSSITYEYTRIWKLIKRRTFKHTVYLSQYDKRFH